MKKNRAIVWSVVSAIVIILAVVMYSRPVMLTIAKPVSQAGPARTTSSGLNPPSGNNPNASGPDNTQLSVSAKAVLSLDILSPEDRKRWFDKIPFITAADIPWLIEAMPLANGGHSQAFLKKAISAISLTSVSEVEKIVSAVKQNSDVRFTEELTAAVIINNAANDFSGFAEYVSGKVIDPVKPGSIDVLASILSSWGQSQDQSAFFEWINGHRDKVSEDSVRIAFHNIATASLQRDPEATSESIKNMPESEARQAYVMAVVDYCIETQDFDSAKSWLKEIKNAKFQNLSAARLKAHEQDK